MYTFFFFLNLNFEPRGLKVCYHSQCKVLKCRTKRIVIHVFVYVIQSCVNVLLQQNSVFQQNEDEKAVLIQIFFHCIFNWSF